MKGPSVTYGLQLEYNLAIAVFPHINYTGVAFPLLSTNKTLWRFLLPPDCALGGTSIKTHTVGYLEFE